MLLPSPVGVAITVGHWLLTRDNQKVYYIEVAGNGNTPEEARMNGFRIAVEQAVGSLIASETEVNQGRVKRDEIISYAAGYVDRFEVVQTDNVGSGWRVTMKVWVGRTALANRLLYQSKEPGRIDGERAAVAVETTQYERGQGDRVLQTVLNDFPRRSFDVEVKKPSVVLNLFRRPELGIPFQVRWNYDYLSSLWSALEATSNNPKAGNCYNNNRDCAQVAFVRVVSGSGGPGIFGWNGTAGFNDSRKMGMVVNELIRSDPAVLLTVFNNFGSVEIQQCYRWPELNHDVAYRTPKNFMVTVGQSQVTVNGDVVFDAFIPVAVDLNNLRRADQVKLEVVRGRDCPNR
jgi:hypothetical protein